MSDHDDPRELLAAAGRFDGAPRTDLARRAVARLRGRHRTREHANEFLRVVNHLLAGFGRLLGPPHE